MRTKELKIILLVILLGIAVVWYFSSQGSIKLQISTFTTNFTTTLPGLFCSQDSFQSYITTASVNTNQMMIDLENYCNAFTSPDSCPVHWEGGQSDTILNINCRSVCNNQGNGMNLWSAYFNVSNKTVTGDINFSSQITDCPPTFQSFIINFTSYTQTSTACTYGDVQYGICPDNITKYIIAQCGPGFNGTGTQWWTATPMYMQCNIQCPQYAPPAQGWCNCTGCQIVPSSPDVNGCAQPGTCGCTQGGVPNSNGLCPVACPTLYNPCSLTALTYCNGACPNGYSATNDDACGYHNCTLTCAVVPTCKTNTTSVCSGDCPSGYVPTTADSCGIHTCQSHTTPCVSIGATCISYNIFYLLVGAIVVLIVIYVIFRKKIAG